MNPIFAHISFLLLILVVIYTILERIYLWKKRKQALDINLSKVNEGLELALTSIQILTSTNQLSEMRAEIDKLIKFNILLEENTTTVKALQTDLRNAFDSAVLNNIKLSVKLVDIVSSVLKNVSRISVTNAGLLRYFSTKVKDTIQMVKIFRAEGLKALTNETLVSMYISPTDTVNDLSDDQSIRKILTTGLIKQNQESFNTLKDLLVTEMYEHGTLSYSQLSKIIAEHFILNCTKTLALIKENIDIEYDDGNYIGDGSEVSFVSILGRIEIALMNDKITQVKVNIDKLRKFISPKDLLYYDLALVQTEGSLLIDSMNDEETAKKVFSTLTKERYYKNVITFINKLRDEKILPFIKPE